MSAKTGFSCALVLAMVGGWTAQAQDAGGPSLADLHKVPAHNPPSETGTPPSRAPLQPDGWISYTHPECCGPMGGHGPVTMEIYMRNGASIAIGGSQISDFLEAGWMIQGGGRTLFFNPAQDAAWTLDLGITNIANRGNTSAGQAINMTVLVPRPAPDPATTPGGATNPNTFNGVLLDSQFLTAPLGNYPQGAAIPIAFGTDPRFPGLTLSSLNRTFVNAGLGREWYWTPANVCTGPVFRGGLDVGGRWGTAKANFKQIPHRSDAITGVYTALHTDMEVPCGGCCRFQLGLRVEWDWTWMSILQSASDISSLNLMATTGVRF